ncbi:MAG: diaminopimelate epimerase, partial [Bacteroidota bacterium]
MPHFRKYHGLGNDYLVIDPVDWPHPMTPEAVRLICDRHTGVGSDGILHGPFQKNGRLSLRIYNPDGSIAEKSGNGIRIFSRFLQERAYVTAATFELDTDGGTVSVAYQEGPERLIRVNMGRVRFNSHAIPMTGPDREVIDEVLEADGQSFRVTAVSIGNPHCVVRSDDISEAAVRALGPLFENHAVFPERTNVQFLRVRDRHAIEIGIWERGAGFTL